LPLSRCSGLTHLSDIQRFQVPYMLKEVAETQDFLKDAFEKSKDHGDLQDLYRRRYECVIIPQIDSLIYGRFPVCLWNPSRLQMPHIREMCANFSLGRTVLMPAILCKSHDMIHSSIT
jgi:hypothetical protein